MLFFELVLVIYKLFFLDFWENGIDNLNRND